jgi:hypothetical protein
LAYDFNNDAPPVDGAERRDPLEVSGSLPGDMAASEGQVPGATSEVPPAAAETPQSPAFVRFRSCRWQQPIEKGSSEFCTHREVKPYAGTIAFDADAWCGDCQHYKVRRIPKKRPRDEDWAY